MYSRVLSPRQCRQSSVVGVVARTGAAAEAAVLCRRALSTTQALQLGKAKEKRTTPKDKQSTAHLEPGRSRAAPVEAAIIRTPWLRNTVKAIGRMVGYDAVSLGAIKGSGINHKACAQRWLDDPFWVQESGLPETFHTWFQVTLLHTYLLIVRFRALPPKTGQAYTQHIVNQLFGDAEYRMQHVYDVKTGSLVKRYLKDLVQQYHGAIASYDQGLVEGDAVLAAAIWRNVFGTGWGRVGGVTSTGRKRLDENKMTSSLETGEEIDATTSADAKLTSLRGHETQFPIALEKIVVWMRKEVSRMEALSDEDVENPRILPPDERCVSSFRSV